MANIASPQAMQDSSGVDLALTERSRPRRGSSRSTVGQIALIAFACLLWLINWVPIQVPSYVFLGNAVATSSRWNQLVSLSRTQAIDSEKIQWLDCVPAVDSRLGSIQSDLKVLKIRVGLQRASDFAFVEREIERLTRPSSTIEATEPLRKSLREQRWRLEVVDHQIQRFRLDCERVGIAMSDVSSAGAFRLASYPKRILPSNSSTSNSSIREDEPANGTIETARRQLTDEDRATWNRLTEMKAIHEGNAKRLEQELEQLVAVSSGHFAFTGAPRISALPGKFSWVRSMFALALSTIMAGVITFGSARFLRRSGRWHSMPKTSSNREFHRVLNASSRPTDPEQESAFEPPKASYDEAEIVRALERHSIAYWGALAYGVSRNEVLRWGTNTPQSTVILNPKIDPGFEALNLSTDADIREDGLSLEAGTRINRFNRYGLFTVDGPAIGDMLLVAWLCVFVLRYGVDSVWRELLFKAPLAAFSSVILGI